MIRYQVKKENCVLMETGFTTKFQIIKDFPIDTHAFLVWLGSRVICYFFLNTERKLYSKECQK